MGIEETQDTRKTISTLFLLPGIGLSRKDILKWGFLSAYIDDLHHDPHYENSVYLLFKPDKIRDFQDFLEFEKLRTPLLIEDYDYPGGYVVVVYSFPKDYALEYSLFKKGKYSKFRKKYKALFPDKVIVVTKEGNKEEKVSLAYHIFNKTDAIRLYWEERLLTEMDPNMEMWSSPDLEGTETLDITHFQSTT
jgi:hypothetical protein